ncbi:GGDEF domain-containing protein [Methyloceanibacter sp.]|uniref:GGDEF domain-containing protein n=1 Tax=Methyloceanibacter sp. TaxID=1965321 RepID=UPI002BA544A0|nr:GGDEF domain-containing protein [Methyloceanibacter sp.]HML91734.1 GGDEF domain-containing protein [Methyloceanibacter sp.]
MDPLFGLDQQTMFRVNALLLIVFAVAFAFAGLGKRDRRYWGLLVTSNLVFAVAFVIFSRRIDAPPEALLVPNGLLVIGLGLRWRAIRTFFGRPSSSSWFLLLSLIVALGLMLSDVLGKGLVFGLTNAIIAAQIVAIMVVLSLERERLSSRWGLVFAYGAVAASSALRVVQGLVLERGMDSLLPGDIFLDLNLIAAAIHISASGAFSLSLAYERSVVGLRETALRDPLTGLYNRRSIQVMSDICKDRTAQRDATLVLLDIDHFKSVNDNYGHVAGDEAIKRCAELIRDTFRKDDFVARIGGEEFVVLLPGKDVNYACRLAETLRKAIEAEPIIFKGNRFKITASFGISHGVVDSHSFSHLLEKADTCLYRAKEAGRNRIEVDGRPAAEPIKAPHVISASTAKRRASPARVA